MSKKRAKRSIRRDDRDRILVTETLPDETPIVFSNQGLYSNLKRKDSDVLLGNLLDLTCYCTSKPPGATTPYRYKILKGPNSYRRLSLLHPHSQFRLKDFYTDNDQSIIYYSSLSPSTIRAPEKVAGTYYEKSSWLNLHQFMKTSVLRTELDQYTKHSPSYFTYRGFSRLYEFFDSPLLLKLESNFQYLQTLDVSKCFDSIYTHSMSWATKGKQFSKQNIQAKATFGDSFDAVIRHGNSNETNGIPIGSEASRIFAEVIFQRIDIEAIERINRIHNLVESKDFRLLRYVDDVYIFANSPRDAEKIYQAYADVLLDYNFHTNAEKSSLSERPFFSAKSRLIRDAINQVDQLIEKVLAPFGEHTLLPNGEKATARNVYDFINSCKHICTLHNTSYHEVSSFLISVFLERIKKIVSVGKRNIDEEKGEQYYFVILAILKIVFFLYSVGPSVKASYKLSTIIVLVSRFSEQKLPTRKNDLYQLIFEEVERITRNLGPASHKDASRYVGLEAVNLVLASRELGDHFLLPENILKTLFLEPRNEEPSYFHLISCLSYIRGSEQYSGLKREALRFAKAALADLSDLKKNSEKAHLLLDLTCCPYISRTQRTKWLKRAFSENNFVQPLDLEVKQYFDITPSIYWFTKWDQVDLLNALEKRELKSAY